MKKEIKITEFEQFFSEVALKKGLSYFKKNDVQLLNKPGKGEYHFMIKNSSLYVKRKGETVISCVCSCGKENCEHLCAVIFYFQSGLFDQFISEKNKYQKQSDLFKKYCALVKEKIVTRQGVLKKMEEISSEIKQLLNNKTDKYYVTLAVLNELSALSLSDSDQKKKSETFLVSAQSRFHRLIQNRPDPGQVNALFRAAMNSISSARRFNSGLFSFLMPYVALHVNDKNALKELKDALAKRAVRYHYPGSLNLKLIANFHIEEAEVRLNLVYKKKNEPNISEFYIAKAERALCADKKTSAVKILSLGYEKLKQKKPANFISFIEYAIKESRRAGDTEKELLLMKEAFIYDYQVNASFTKRIKVLLDEKREREFYNEVIDEIKKSNHETFDKLSVLLFAEERYEELIKEIGKQHNKFRLLNEVAIKMLPRYNDFLFKVYIKQFQSSVNSASEPYYQQQIFNDARRYLDKLPEEERTQLIKTIASGFGGNSYLRNLISKTYMV